MEKKFKSFMQMLLEGQEHERIKTELTQYANSIGYTKKVTFENGMEPDVLYLNVDGDNLFMGDAKDSANETPSNSKTAERIYGYIETFGDCLTAGQIKGGFIAISTNDLAAANAWKTWLNDVCKKNRIYRSRLHNKNYFCKYIFNILVIHYTNPLFCINSCSSADWSFSVRLPKLKSSGVTFHPNS